MFIRPLVLFLITFSFLPRGSAQPQASVPAKKPIPHSAYDSWRSIVGNQISADGKWAAYTLQPQDGDGELVVRSLTGTQEFRQARGRGAQFSADAGFVVFGIAPAKADVEKARKEKRAPAALPKSGFGILNVATGKSETIESVKSFSVGEKGGRFVAYLLEPKPETPAKSPEPPKPAEKTGTDDASDLVQAPRRQRPGGAAAPPGPNADGAKKKETGSELIVRSLTGGTPRSIPEVVAYTWNSDGSRLAYVVSSKTPEKDGVYLLRADTIETSGPPVALLTGLGNYRGLTWSEDGKHLAFLTDRDDYKAETPALALYRADDKAAALAVDNKTTGIPAGMVLSENGNLIFSKDGKRLFFGVAPAPKPKVKDAPDPINVDIWSYTDDWLQPMQKARAEAEKKRTYLTVWPVGEKKVIPLETPEWPEARLDREADRYLLATSDLPYRKLVSWDQGYEDVGLVDITNGTRRRLLTRHPGAAYLSTSGRYLLSWDETTRAWFVQDCRSERATPRNLTKDLPVAFHDEDNDVPGDPGPYGQGGWTNGDQAVLLFDRYDIWEVRPDTGKARRLTDGRSRKLTFRPVRLDPEERTWPTDRPLLLSATDERTRATGYFQRAPLSVVDAPTQKLVLLDKSFLDLRKAKNADTITFRLSRFDEFPNLWTARLGDLANMTRLSDANPQQSGYIWGKSEIVEFRNADGKPMRGILTRPENYDPSRKYPLMVYIYEELTQNLHTYVPPSPGTSINVSRYVSNGYLVLRPDITYKTGYPGESAEKCVLPAVQELVRRGMVDPERIGIQGHSWGAYQVTHLITRTNIFRAVEAGAPVANMTSAYGGIRWESGMSRAFQYEKTQSRIGGTPWNMPLQFIENSPLFWVDKVQTPYLCLHNDADGAVPWYQGIEFFSALRRLGKEAYLFNYNGEGHGITGRENQKHWTVHMAEFFDHYLLGAPRPEWMNKGVPYSERGTRDLRGIYGTATAPTAPPPGPQPPK